jgi:ADP-ribose pyrophosphatase YjhB (NUDIX family)
MEKNIMEEKKDIRLMIGDVKFSCRSVGVIIANNRILFQKRKGDQFWALPGGAISVLEKGQNVPLRELEEETGIKSGKIDRLLWVAEYFFEYASQKNHQYAFYYKINISKKEKLINVDEFDGIEEGKNIIYKWVAIEDIKSTPIKPDFLIDKLSNIKDNVEFIFASEFE